MKKRRFAAQIQSLSCMHWWLSNIYILNFLGNNLSNIEVTLCYCVTQPDAEKKSDISTLKRHLDSNMKKYELIWVLNCLLSIIVELYLDTLTESCRLLSRINNSTWWRFRWLERIYTNGHWRCEWSQRQRYSRRRLSELPLSDSNYCTVSHINWRSNKFRFAYGRVKCICYDALNYFQHIVSNIIHGLIPYKWK